MVTTTSAARTTSLVTGLGKLLGHVDTDLGHGLHDRGVDALGWLGARRADVDTPLGVVVEQRCRHLGAARVVDADEQDLGHLGHDSSFGLGEGAGALSGEATGEHTDS